MATTCITNNITLAPGENFVLPPGASIIGVSDIDNLSSDCIDLSSLEEATCFVTSLASRSADSDGHSEFFEKDQQSVYGFYLNNVYTAFDTPVINSGSLGSFDMSVIYGKLKAAIPAILTGAVTYDADVDNGTRSNLSIKTFASIARNLQLYVETSASYGSGSTITSYRSSFITLSEAITAGYTDYAACP